MAVGALGRPLGAPPGLPGSARRQPPMAPRHRLSVKFNVNSQLFCELRALATSKRALLRRDTCRLGL